MTARTTRTPQPVLSRQVAVFSAVSVATTVVDVGLFNLLIRLDVVGLLTANTMSYGAGIVASYLLNGWLTFPAAEDGREGRGRRAALFLVVNLVGLWLNNAAVALTAATLGSSPALLNAAKLAAGAGTWGVKFLVFRRWVYRA